MDYINIIRDALVCVLNSIINKGYPFVYDLFNSLLGKFRR